MSGGVVFEIRLRPAPGSDGLRGLRAILKMAWRAHRLRCISVALVTDAAQPPSEDNTPPLPAKDEGR